MDKIRLKDKTEFEICEGASLDDIKIIVQTFNEIETITNAFTKKDNLSDVKFITNDVITGDYSNLVYVNFSYLPNLKVTSSDDTKEETEEIDSYIVTISLRESTEIELRIKALEAGHISNAEAIETILTDIIPSIDENEDISE